MRSLWTFFNIRLCQIYRRGLHRPKRVLWVAALILALLSCWLPKIKAVYSFQDMVDPKLRQSRLLERYRQEFYSGESAFVVFSPVKGRLQDPDVERIRKFLARMVSEIPGLESLTSPFSLRRPAWNGRELWYPALLQSSSALELEKIKDTPWAGIFSDKDGHDLAAEFSWSKEESRNVTELLRALESEFPPGVALQYHVAGDAVFQHYSREGVQRSVLLSGLMLLLIMLLCRGALGTWRAGFLYCFVVSFASTATFGLMSFFGITVDLLTSGLLIMLAVAGLEDFLFVSVHRLDQKAAGNWRASFRAILLPGFYTSLTTILGFLSLCASDLFILRNFGLWAGIGAAIEWLATLVLLPAFLAWQPWWSHWVNPKKIWIRQSPTVLLSRHLPGWLAGILLLVVPLGIYSSFHLQLTGAPKLMMNASHPYVQGLRYLKDSRGWEDRIRLVFPRGLDDPKSQMALTGVTQFPNVARVQNLRAIKTWLVANIPAKLVPTVLLDVEHSVEARTLLSHARQESVDLYIKDSQLQPMSQFLTGIKRACGDEKTCYPAGEIASFADFSNQIPGAFVSSFGTSLVTIGLILILLVRFTGQRWKFAIPVFVAASWGPMVTLSALWVFDIRTNFLTCLFASTLMGMAGDNAVQFLFASRHRRLEDGINLRAHGSLVVSGIVICAALIYLGSYFPSSRVLGCLLAAGLLAAALGDIWIMRFLLRPFKGRDDCRQGAELPLQISK